MRTYHKIDTPFKRDMDGSKKLILDEYRDETVWYLRNNNWVFTEKIDGTNIRVIWDGHYISFGGRTDKAQIPKPLLEFLTSQFSNAETEQLFEQLFGEKEVVLYGEGYGPGIQKVGRLYRDDVSFILFDIQVGDIWLRRGDLEEIAQALNIAIVPVVGFGTLDEAIEFVKTRPQSTIGTAPMEGVVCRPFVELRSRNGERVIVKIKVRDFAD